MFKYRIDFNLKQIYDTIFRVVHQSQGLSLHFMCFDQRAKYRMFHGFP